MSDVLPKLVPVLGKDPVHLQAVREAINSMNDDISRIGAHAMLLPAMDTRTRDAAQRELLRQVHEMRASWQRQRAMASLVLYIDNSLRPSLISEAFSAARKTRA